MTGDDALSRRFALTVMNAGMLLAGLGVDVFLILREPSVENTVLVGIVSTVVGALINNHTASQGWWFATSKGSSDKTQLLTARETPPDDTTT